MAEKKKQGGRVSKYRNFTFLIYPESAPAEWADMLAEKLGHPMVVSPLHDQDVSELKEAVTMEQAIAIQNGEVVYKKAHYHVMLCMGNGPRTIDAVRKQITRILGAGVVSKVQPVDNVLAMYKYFTHETENAIKQGKHLYSREDMRTFNNFDIDREGLKDSQFKSEISLRISQDILDYGLSNMWDLYTFAAATGRYSQTLILETTRTNTSFFKTCFDGSYRAQQKGVEFPKWPTADDSPLDPDGGD